MLPLAMTSTLPATQLQLPLLEWLLEHAPLGIAWISGDEHVQVNAEAARLTGLSERRVPLPEWTRRVRLADAGGRFVHAEDERPLFGALEGRTTERTRMQILHRDGTRVDVCVQAFPWRTSQTGSGAVVLLEDVSWSLDSEREQAQWLGALGHELNGALQHLLTASQAAEVYLGRDPARAVHHLRSAQRQTRLMGRLVKDFVEAAQLGAGIFNCRDEPVAIGPLLSDLVESAELADARHRIVQSVSPDLWVHADVDRLRQIFTNLLSNAAKYSSPGQLELGARRDGSRVLMWLRDDGPGIPSEAREHIFRRFRRLPSESEGSGMGLWIARELAVRMGGDLWLQSSEGMPSTFFVALPRIDLSQCLAGEQAGGRGA